MEVSTDPLTYVMLVFFVLGMLFVNSGNIRAVWPAPIEEGREPIYRGRMAGLVGFHSYGGWTLNLRVYNDFLVLDGFERIILPFQQIDRIEVTRPWPGIGRVTCRSSTISRTRPNALS